MANEKAYRRGFMDKLAEFSKLAGRAEDNAIAAAGRKAYWAAEDKKNGVVEPEKYVQPTTLKGHLAYGARRLGKNISSLGRAGMAATWNTLNRGVQGAIDFGMWVPLLADEYVNGKLLGIDEGRGVLGRVKGDLDRAFDRNVHAARQWSSDYDYRNRINGGFNRFLTGKGSDMAGAFLGWGGYKKGLITKAFAGLGALSAAGEDGQAGQLRARERWLDQLHPALRAQMDPLSTAYNQEHAPTLAEYRRYHMPSMADMPTSYAGYTNIPWNWSHQWSNRPVQFRDFGT